MKFEKTKALISSIEMEDIVELSSRKEYSVDISTGSVSLHSSETKKSGVLVLLQDLVLKSIEDEFEEEWAKYSRNK